MLFQGSELPNHIGNSIIHLSVRLPRIFVKLFILGKQYLGQKDHSDMTVTLEDAVPIVIVRNGKKE